MASVLVVALLATGCSAGADERSQPGCALLTREGLAGDGAYGTRERGVMVLAAQAVPSATLLPCIATYPVGWSFSGMRIADGEFRFWLDSDRAGIHAVEVVLSPGCEVGDAVEVLPANDEAGTRRFEEPLSLPPSYAADRFYTFEGGCIVYHIRFHGTDDATLALEVDQALSFRNRSEIVDELADIGLSLCGASAPPCAGEGT